MRTRPVRSTAPATNYVKRGKARRAPRFWSVRWARGFEALYDRFSRVLVTLHPLFNAIGYGRLERPVALVERGIKYTLFDCRMCGQCILGATGMACPMNCPKNLRNGPCGGVRVDGMCEVEPDMPCVWVEAWTGSRSMRDGDAILDVQPPLDHGLRDTSSWLHVVREAAHKESAAKNPESPESPESPENPESP